MVDWAWELVGAVGYFFLFLRWVVQWWASEKEKRSITPTTFWVLTLVASIIMLPYTLTLDSVVLPLSFVFTIGLSARNIWIEWGREK